MRKNFSYKFILVAAVILIAAGCSKQQTQTNTQQASQSTPTQSQTKGSVQNGQTATPAGVPSKDASAPQGSKVEYVKYQGQDGKNALELLKATHTVETKTFGGIGEYVDAIDGMKADSQHFWSFYVNGKASTVGAGSYATKSNDIIEWKFEKIQ